MDTMPVVSPLSVGQKVSSAAEEALSFLRARDEFWKQVELGAKGRPANIKTTRLNFGQIQIMQATQLKGM